MSHEARISTSSDLLCLAYGRGLVLWQRCNALYTSGIVDDVMFLRVTALYVIARNAVYAMAIPSVRLSVCLSVCHTDESVKNG